MNQDVLTTDETKKSTMEDLFEKLSTTEKGLFASELEKRLLQFGRNEIPEKKANPAVRFLRYTVFPAVSFLFLMFLRPILGIG